MSHEWNEIVQANQKGNEGVTFRAINKNAVPRTYEPLFFTKYLLQPIKMN